MALRSVNLVPSDILTRLHYVRHVWLWVVIQIFLLTPIFTFLFYQVNIAMAQKASLQTMGSINKNIKEKVVEIDAIKKDLEKLNQQLADLETVVGGHSYSNILYVLSESMNRQTWLQSLDINSDNNDAQLSLNGFATSNEALGELLNTLSSEPLFDNVVLNYAKEPHLEKNETGMQDFRRIEFEMSCSIASRSGKEK